MDSVATGDAEIIVSAEPPKARLESVLLSFLFRLMIQILSLVPIVTGIYILSNRTEKSSFLHSELTGLPSILVMAFGLGYWCYEFLEVTLSARLDRFLPLKTLKRLGVKLGRYVLRVIIVLLLLNTFASSSNVASILWLLFMTIISISIKHNIRVEEDGSVGSNYGFQEMRSGISDKNYKYQAPDFPPISSYFRSEYKSRFSPKSDREQLPNWIRDRGTTLLFRYIRPNTFLLAPGEFPKKYVKWNSRLTFASPINPMGSTSRTF
jgi:hypothetical protein